MLIYTRFVCTNKISLKVKKKIFKDLKEFSGIFLEFLNSSFFFVPTKFFVEIKINIFLLNKLPLILKKNFLKSFENFLKKIKFPKN